MRFIEIPEIHKIHGKEAVNALNDFIRELEQQGDKQLSEKQTTALIKFAEGLISSIEAETQSRHSKKDIKKMQILAQLEKEMMRDSPESDLKHEKDKIYSLPVYLSQKVSGRAIA